MAKPKPFSDDFENPHRALNAVMHIFTRNTKRDIRKRAQLADYVLEQGDAYDARALIEHHLCVVRERVSGLQLGIVRLKRGIAKVAREGSSLTAMTLLFYLPSDSRLKEARLALLTRATKRVPIKRWIMTFMMSPASRGTSLRHYEWKHLAELVLRSGNPKHASDLLYACTFPFLQTFTTSLEAEKLRRLAAEAPIANVA